MHVEAVGAELLHHQQRVRARLRVDDPGAERQGRPRPQQTLQETSTVEIIRLM
jgi:hypothetical protein